MRFLKRKDSGLSSYSSLLLPLSDEQNTQITGTVATCALEGEDYNTLSIGVDL